MAVFVTIETDLFISTFSRISNERKVAGRAGTSSARRPLRGLEVKSDTHAVLRVVGADGKEIDLISGDNVDGTTTDYTAFILQAVQEARMEKHQIIETFGASYIFFFGENPRFLDINATLINSQDFNWAAEWWANYEQYFRGTKLTEMGARLYMMYDDNVVEGYMLNAVCSRDSSNEHIVNLQFRLYLTNHRNISNLGSDDFPIGADVRIPEGTSLTTLMNGEQLAALAAGGSGFTGSYVNGSFVSSVGLERNQPLRGKTWDNWDEWTGPYPDPAIEEQAAMEGIEEVEDTGTATTDAVDEAAPGAGDYIDSPEAWEQSGLMGDGRGDNGFGGGIGFDSSFESSFSSGFSASAGFGSSFGGSAGFGAGIGGSAGASAGFGASARASAGLNSSTGGRANAGFGGTPGGGSIAYGAPRGASGSTGDGSDIVSGWGGTGEDWGNNPNSDGTVPNPWDASHVAPKSPSVFSTLFLGGNE